MLKGKKILLGITGSIAAYKAATLARLFIKNGAQVKVIMTPLAKEFITPVTMATLSKNTVLCDFFNYDNGEWNSHVDLGLWADVFIIAPATANTMAKMANGICDNLLLTSYLSVRCQVMLAPAMDLDMFKHPATLKNIETLKSYGDIIIEPAAGELASGLEGKGRMEEPDKILEAVADFFAKKKSLNKRVLVSAGPTYEAIDPVRFIGNHSSGKMGFAIAEELANQGAEVVLVAGPVSANVNHPSIKRIDVVSAEEMYVACKENFPRCDVAIMTAAVADYTPIEKLESKYKSDDSNFAIELKSTKDIAQSLGKMKSGNQKLVGFALETNDEVENAQKKILKKNFDFIVLNSLNDEGAGFKHDTNKITIINKNGETQCFPLKSKKEVARDIVEKLRSIL